MAKQEPMTSEPTSTQEHGELSGPTAAAPGGRGQAGRGVAGWFGGLSRGRKLALTWSASVLAVVIALLAIGATSGGGPGHAPPPRAHPDAT